MKKTNFLILLFICTTWYTTFWNSYKFDDDYRITEVKEINLNWNTKENKILKYYIKNNKKILNNKFIFWKLNYLSKF